MGECPLAHDAVGLASIRSQRSRKSLISHPLNDLNGGMCTVETIIFETVALSLVPESRRAPKRNCRQNFVRPLARRYRCVAWDERLDLYMDESRAGKVAAQDISVRGIPESDG